MTEEKKPALNMSENIQAKWSKLTEGDIKTIGQDMKILANKVSSVYGRSKADVEKEIAEFQKSFSK